ncbi:2001_t:CDS:2 [Acaulospora morrowiae]|uniref:2001_t:CDS:1 n=1 Tax=Acaulospora morrowiae TaxID=94023 RepID=A0A9N9C9A2_9GLOM|nr:2001_t:CDS:2 [Acaulospora morrowiae]
MFRATSVFFLIVCFVFGIRAANVAIQVGVGPGGFSFSPQNVTVNTGDTLTFTWVNGLHSVVQNDGPAGSCTKSSRASIFNSGQIPSGTFVYNVTETSGNIYYYCDVTGHCERGMWGVITVGGGSSASSGPSSSPSPTSSTSSTGSSSNTSSTGATSTKSSASSTSTSVVTILMLMLSAIIASFLA